VDRLRSATGAVVVALHPGRDLGGVIDRVITEMSHSFPFDIALMLATNRAAMLIGERPGLDRAQLPIVARRMAQQAAIAREHMTSAEPPDPGPTEAEPGDPGPTAAFLPGVDDELTAIADGPFRHEHGEATAIAHVGAAMDAEMDVAESRSRWLQADLGDPADSGFSQVLRRRSNRLNVFIGPLVERAAAAPHAFAETDLPWDAEDAEAFRLTIGFIPLHPRGRAQLAELELPRVGASEPVSFHWNLRRAPGQPEQPAQREKLERASARILVLFRNRVLQTAVVTGTFDAPITLEEAVALRPDLGGLDDRQPFDVALFANHDDRDVPALIRASKGHLQFDPMAGLDGVVSQLATILGGTVSMTQTKQGLKSDRVRTLLIDLAGKGRDLYQMLQQLGSLEGAQRIQMVSARSSWFLPIELAYRRWAPDPAADVCPAFIDGKARCDGACPKDNDRSVVCPNAFWGLEKIIERIAFDPVLHADLNGKFLMLVAPRANKRQLSVELAALGASSRVRPVDVTALIGALGQGSVHANGWPDWTTAIADADLDLLVLLPHTEYGPTQSFMEIGRTKLERGHMETDVVRRSPAVKPAVILFGCQTTGTADDSAGFANRFMQNGAALVFGSLTLLLGRHAAALAQRLSDDMRAAKDAHVPVGEVLMKFRRRAVQDGQLAALAVTAYGDADWTL
jgi:hypothetical protein